MIDPALQEILAAATVILAAAWMMRRLWRARHARSCPACPAARPRVALDPRRHRLRVLP